jgi:hypothetical protein
MLNSLRAIPSSRRLMLFGILTAAVLIIVITFVLQPAGLRPSGRISPDSQKSTASAPVEMPKALPNQAFETVLQPPATPEDVTLSPSVNNRALQQSVGSKHRAISSRARAEVPYRSRDRNAARRPARSLGLGLAPREQSFTGARGTFDAVH